MAMLHNRYTSSNESKTDLVQKMVPGLVSEGLVDATFREINEIKAFISRKMSSVNIDKVKKVKNSFLEAMYMLKKEEYKHRNPVVKEEILIHVTGATNVLPIIRNNFDWRRVKRGKFGIGTSFSGDASYANKYANYNIGYERAFIVCKVLIGKVAGGKYGLKVPPLKCDTTTGNGDKVYVKFYDHEVLPLYVVYYTNEVVFPQDRGNISIPRNINNDYLQDSRAQHSSTHNNVNDVYLQVQNSRPEYRNDNDANNYHPMNVAIQQFRPQNLNVNNKHNQNVRVQHSRPQNHVNVDNNCIDNVRVQNSTPVYHINVDNDSIEESTSQSSDNVHSNGRVKVTLSVIVFILLLITIYMKT